MNVFLNYRLSTTGEKAHLAKFGRLPEKCPSDTLYYTVRVSESEFAGWTQADREIATRSGAFRAGGDFAARLMEIVTPGKIDDTVANSRMPKATTTEPTLDVAPMTPAEWLEIARQIEAANAAALAAHDETLHAYFAAYIPQAAAAYFEAAAKFKELYSFQQPDAGKEKEAARLGIDMAAALAASRAAYAQSRTIVAERRAKAEADEEKRKEAARAKQEADRAAWHAEKERWSAEHGSDRLRRAVERGHDCTALYARERAAVDAPGYTVDIYDAARWKSAACPTTETLDEADTMTAKKIGTSVEIVWLTDAPADSKSAAGEYEEASYFEPSLAVVVSEYLGRYDLIRQM